MTVENKLRPTSPVHVHVDDDIPVHVHVKKTKSKKSKVVTKKRATSSLGLKGACGSNLKPKSGARSRSPGGGPWVPPPGKTTKGSKLAWEGRAQRIDMPTIVREYSGDLSTDEEDKAHGTMRNYEKKIDSLMSEVGTLKNEVDLQKALQEIDKRDDLLDTSQRVIQQQDDEIHNYQAELNSTEKENRILRQNVDILKGDVIPLSEAEMFRCDQEQLMKKLIEVEMDGQSVAEQMRALQDILRRSKDGSSEKLTKQKDLLLEKISDFDTTNRILRRLLRDQHSQEAATLRLNEQRELLMKKVADVDRANERLKCELRDRERITVELQDQVDSQKAEMSALGNLQGTLESTRGHLQKQLRSKDSDCNRLAVQIRTLEGTLAQNTIDMEHLQKLVDTAKERADKDKESLKKATRRVKELEKIVDQVEENTMSKSNSLKDRLYEKSSELSNLKSENDRLKSTISSIEHKFTQAEEDVMSLRSNLKKYEHLVEEYKDQMHKSRREADDSVIKLEEQKLETGRLQKDGKEELEKVKARLHQRLKELDPLPELLRSTEAKLQEANERLLMYEIKNTESTKVISELSAKVEHTNGNKSSIKSRLHETEDENRTLNSRLDTLERKFRDSEEQIRELMSNVAKREETIHQNQLRLEEKSRENASLTRQLENALADNRRQNEEYKDRYNSKERTYQSRIVDLESQLSQLRTEIARIKREKEENERKFNSRLYDLKDRLEQCHSTNRSMQNYVHFLKNSYANVFGDTAIGLPSTSPIVP